MQPQPLFEMEPSDLKPANTRRKNWIEMVSQMATYLEVVEVVFIRLYHCRYLADDGAGRRDERLELTLVGSVSHLNENHT